MNNANKEKKGIIMHALGSWCDKIASSMKKSALYRLLTGYEKSQDLFYSSATRNVISSCTTDNKGVFRKTKHAISLQFERSLILSMASTLSKRMQMLPLRVYGMFFITFGAYTAISYLIKAFALLSPSADVTDLFCALAVMLVALPMFFSSKSLAEAFGASKIMRPALMGIFGIPAESFEKRPREVRMQSLAVILGLILGVLTYFISPLNILISLAAVALLWLLMSFPEAGAILTVALAPFMSFAEHPTVTVVVFVLITAFSYGVKLLRGKRVFRFESSDLPVLFLWIVLLFGAVSPMGVGGYKEALVLSSLMLVYFLVSNLVRSRKWLNVTVILFIASATVTAFLGLAEYILGFSEFNWLDASIFSDISGRATSVFENPNVLAAYLIMAFPTSVAVCFYNKERRIKVLCAICSLVMLACIVFTWSRGAWIALVCGTMLFLLCISRRAFLIVPPAAGAALLASWAFPTTFGARLANIFSLADSTNHYRVSIWEGVSDMLGKIWACGIGFGEESFSAAYLDHSLAGIEHAPHAHSLYLQLLVQVGVFGLVFLLLSVAMAAQKVFTHHFNEKADKSSRLIATACFAGVVSMLVFGVFDYAWYNYRVFFVFWMLMGLSSAAVNVGREDVRITEVSCQLHSEIASENAQLTVNFRKEQ
jgi:O-antigen ligase